MKRTTAPFSVGGKYVDRNISTGTTGTTSIAEDRNNVQEEICNVILAAGIALDGAKQDQLATAIAKMIDEKTTEAVNAGNAASADKLKTARTIGGVSFDGTRDINLPGVNARGNQDTTGNAATADHADEAEHASNADNAANAEHANESSAVNGLSLADGSGGSFNYVQLAHGESWTIPKGLYMFTAVTNGTTLARLVLQTFSPSSGWPGFSGSIIGVEPSGLVLSDGTNFRIAGYGGAGAGALWYRKLC